MCECCCLIREVGISYEADFTLSMAFISARTSLPQNNRAVHNSSGWKVSELGILLEKKLHFYC